MMEMPSLKPMLRTSSVAGVLDPGETGLAVQADGSVRGTLPAGHSEATLTYANVSWAQHNAVWMPTS